MAGCDSELNCCGGGILIPSIWVSSCAERDGPRWLCPQLYYFGCCWAKILCDHHKFRGALYMMIKDRKRPWKDYEAYG